MNMKCPICDSEKNLTRTTDYAPIRVGNHQFTVEVDADTCECGEVFVDAASVVAAEKRVAAHLAKHGHMDQEIFKFTRKSLGLTAGALADKMGVSETTISRWENDKSEIPRSAAAVLSLMVLQDEAIPVIDILDFLKKPVKIKVTKLKRARTEARPKKTTLAMAQELTAQILSEEAAGVEEG